MNATDSLDRGFLDTSKSDDQDDQDGQMHQQTAHAHEKFPDPERHAEIEGQDAVV
jgi:hypothetical protein